MNTEPEEPADVLRNFPRLHQDYTDRTTQVSPLSEGIATNHGRLCRSTATMAGLVHERPGGRMPRRPFPPPPADGQGASVRARMPNCVAEPCFGQSNVPPRMPAAPRPMVIEAA